MSLLLRFDDVEHVLRSVGETHPGIIGIGHDDGRFAFTVSSSWMPSKDSEKVMQGAIAAGIIAGVVPEVGEPDESVVYLETAEVLGACATDRDLFACLQSAQATVEMCWQARGRLGDVSTTRAALAFVEEVYDWIAENKIRRGE